jgi:hypothetical protein
VPKCTCDDKTKCCHILAVLRVNGIDIKNSFYHMKMSSYSQIVKVANGGALGRLKQGHAKNTTFDKVVDTI